MMAFLKYAITLAAIAFALACLAALRLRTILDRERPKASRDSGSGKTHLLIVLGSGGHSAEMLRMLERAVTDEDSHERLDWRDYSYRTWVVGIDDHISARRAKEFEDIAAKLQQAKGKSNGTIDDGQQMSYRIVTVRRARNIHQSLLTTPVSCLRCMAACWRALLPSSDFDFPDLILCNGPATATILVFTSLLMRFFNVRGCNSKGKMRTIYVESWARVKRLSLSGKLMLWVVDRFFVQWPQLLEWTKGKGEYIGVLV